ncbi:tetratricopeptide repeat protein [Nodosilinea nodulosa]|uniref:tetratricopeptide repeat protein n=1 Tax=Nodosilinea nodulosa TaxID=416001 RepID=UPI000375EDC8|nr:tetratricopeptide repeat protein [Nodosilinea nodulosa]
MKKKTKKLLNEIRSLNFSDKLKADKLFEEGIELYEGGEVNSAMQSLKKALNLSKKIQHWFGASVCLYNLGIAFTSLRDLPSALSSFKESQKIADEFGFVGLQMNAPKQIGDIYIKYGQYDLAVRYLMAAIQVAQAIGEDSELSRLTDRLDIIFYYQGRYQEAIHNHSKGLLIARNKSDLNLEMICLINLANAYQAISNYNYSIDLYNQALQASQSQEKRDLSAESEILGNMGATYHYLGNEKLAIYYSSPIWFMKRIRIDAFLGN